MFFVYIFLCLVVTHVSVANNVCPKCGDIEVPYPLSTNQNCGNPNYKIYCNNGGTLEFLGSQGIYYKILSVNPNTSKLVIEPPPLQKDSCLSSDLSVEGLKLDDKLPFNISTHNTVMLFNCSETILLSPLNCTSSSYCRRYEEANEKGIGCKNTLCCHFLKDSAMTSHRIRTRVGGCTAYTSVVDLKPSDPVEAWNYGIELQWLPPN